MDNRWISFSYFRLADGQWQSKIFTSAEQNLFITLDTANLAGTTTPDSVLEIANQYNCIFPNPFSLSSGTQDYFRFNSGYSGQLIFKYVIVNSSLVAVDKNAIRIQATSYPSTPGDPSSSNLINIAPNIPIGEYRLYFTLSSQNSRHFYKSWGNIHIKQWWLLPTCGLLLCWRTDEQSAVAMLSTNIRRT